MKQTDEDRVNSFSFRYRRNGTRYQGEYRLAHWAGFKAVMSETGEPIMFTDPHEAKIAAAQELVSALNGNSAFWRGGQNNDARQAAEQLFARDTNG